VVAECNLKKVSRGTVPIGTALTGGYEKSDHIVDRVERAADVYREGGG
jgi:hypothetical protein